MTNQQLFAALINKPTDAVLQEYARADIVIIKCVCGNWAIPHQMLSHLRPTCLTCGEAVKCLLATGEWQSAEERRRENLERLQK